MMRWHRGYRPRDYVLWAVEEIRRRNKPSALLPPAMRALSSSTTPNPSAAVIS